LHFPFQLLCVALSMDTNESLLLVESSMATLRTVQQYFPTKRVQKAVRMADYLVRMCERKKLEAAETLRRSMQAISYKKSNSGATPSEETSQALLSQTSLGSSYATVQVDDASLPTTSYGIDQVGLDLFDWDKFLRSDFAVDLGFSDP
jgi:hypothetical protein